MNLFKQILIIVVVLICDVFIVTYNYDTINTTTTCETCKIIKPIILSEDKINKKENIMLNQISKDKFKRILIIYIKDISKISDDKYILKVAEGYLDLLKMNPDKHSVLFYISLCGVESHYNMKKINKGAIGISQVIYSLHKKYISELGISKYNFFNSPKHNILAGYMIWNSYFKNNGYNYKISSYKYLGTRSDIYYYKILENYFYLSNLIINEL